MELAQPEEELSKPERETRLGQFLEFQTAQSTKVTYRGGLKKFFAVIYPNLPLEEAAEQYFEGREEKDFEKDVKGFIISMVGKQTLAPSSMRTHLASVRAFLEDNRVILPSAVWRRMGRKLGGGKVTEDKQPTDEELVRIFEHLPLHGRALFHLLATSGIRIGSALRLTINDIQLNADHVQITVRAPGEKKRVGFIAFASEQTKELLEEWLKVREDYLTSAVNRTRGPGVVKDAKDDRVFPMHGRTANLLWRKALEATELDERDPNTGWTIHHSHTLRARVRSRMAMAGVSPDIAYALIGQRTYLDTYKDWTPEEKLEHYKTAEPFLIFSGTTTTVKELDEKMEKENKNLQFQVDILTRELTRLTTENENFKKQVNAILALGSEKMTRQERYDSEMKSVKERKKKVLQ